MLFLIRYSYKASFYNNIRKAQWERFPTPHRKHCLKYKNFLKNINSFIFILFIVLNFINDLEKYLLRSTKQLYFNRMRKTMQRQVSILKFGLYIYLRLHCAAQLNTDHCYQRFSNEHISPL